MRLSVSNWQTDEEEAELAADAVLSAYERAVDGAG
jgi:hypothetical protein